MVINSFNGNCSLEQTVNIRFVCLTTEGYHWNTETLKGHQPDTTRREYLSGVRFYIGNRKWSKQWVVVVCLLQGLMMILLFAKKINDGNQFCSVLFCSVHLLRHANVLFVLQLLSDTGSHKDSIRPGHSNLKDFSTTTIYLFHLNFTLTFYFVGRSLPIFFFFLIHIYCSCFFFLFFWFLLLYV